MHEVCGDAARDRIVRAPGGTGDWGGGEYLNISVRCVNGWVGEALIRKESCFCFYPSWILWSKRWRVTSLTCLVVWFQVRPGTTCGTPRSSTLGFTIKGYFLGDSSQKCLLIVWPSIEPFRGLSTGSATETASTEAWEEQTGLPEVVEIVQNWRHLIFHLLILSLHIYTQ